MSSAHPRRRRIRGSARLFVAATLTTGLGVGLGTLPSSVAAPGDLSAKTSVSAKKKKKAVFKAKNSRELRQAISKANKRSGKDKIRLSGNIKFRQKEFGAGGPFKGDLDITDDLEIVGRGFTINANDGDRVFDVRAGAKLILRNATLTNGTAGPGQSGGLVYVAGDFSAFNSTFKNGVVRGDAASGGAIMNDGGTVRLTNSVVSNNTAVRAGGGIEANAGTTLLFFTQLRGNDAGQEPGNGGGLHLTDAGNVQIYNSVAINNTAVQGGALWNSGTGTMLVRQSRLAENEATGAAATDGGGGFYNDGGEAFIGQTIIEDNTASGAAGSGGGAFNDEGDVTFEGNAITGNSANRAGGGIEAVAGTTTVNQSFLDNNSVGTAPGNGGAFHLTGAGSVTVDNSTVSNNTATEGGGLWNSSTGTFDVVNSSVLGNTASGAAADQGGGGLYNDGGELTVTRTVVSDNVADGAAGSGGGILNNMGTLDIDQSELANNTSIRAGGAIEAVAGTTTIDTTSLHDNSTGGSPGNGGAFHLTGAGTVEVSDSDVSDNTATLEGGGLWNSISGTMTVTNTNFSGNDAQGAAADNGGGALFNDGDGMANGGDLTVVNSTFDENTASGMAGSGGGIFNNAGALEVLDSTFTRNEASRAGGGIETLVGDVDILDTDMSENTTGPTPGNGGAIHISGAGSVAIAGGSYEGNSATNEGGGLWTSSTGEMTATDVRVIQNMAPTGPNVFTQPGGDMTINGMVIPSGQNALEFP